MLLKSKTYGCRVLLIGVILIFCASCGTIKEIGTMSTTIPSKGRNLSDFSFLKPSISYDEVVANVGLADRDIGSGLHILVYQLGDGKELQLSFANLDSLLGASLYNPQTDTYEQIKLVE